MKFSAFTEQSDHIEDRLLNKVIVSANGQKDQAVAQWDTGATNTCISEEIVKKYNLKPISVVQSKTPSGILKTSAYLLEIKLNDEVRFPRWVVIGSKIGAQGIDVLIGMEIISKGDFAVSNYKNRTRFSFRIPSQQDVDYTRSVEMV